MAGTGVLGLKEDRWSLTLAAEAASHQNRVVVSRRFLKPMMLMRSCPENCGTWGGIPRPRSPTWPMTIRPFAQDPRR